MLPEIGLHRRQDLRQERRGGVIVEINTTHRLHRYFTLYIGEGRGARRIAGGSKQLRGGCAQTLGRLATLGDGYNFSRSSRLRDRQFILPQSLEVECNRFPDEFLCLFLGAASGDHSRQIGDIGTPSGGGL